MPSSVLKTDGCWLIDPIMFDCAYQMSLIWSQEFSGMMPLPGNIGEFRQYQPCCSPVTDCEVIVKKVNTPVLHLDFIFRDQRSGRLQAVASDVQVIMSRDLNRRVLKGLTGRSGNRDSGAQVA